MGLFGTSKADLQRISELELENKKLKDEIVSLERQLKELSSQNQNDSSRNLADEVHSASAIGCLCYLKPRYTGVLNQWTQGGATIDLHDDGSFTVSAFQIQDGVVI